jgi:hypothetical protein
MPIPQIKFFALFFACLLRLYTVIKIFATRSIAHSKQANNLNNDIYVNHNYVEAGGE